VDPQSADETAQAAASLAPGELGAAQAAVRAALGGDTSSISALRVLKLYLERLGAEFGGAEGLAPVAGAALALLPAAVCAPALRARHPSLVAAAALLAGRRAAGVTPFWPHALLALTGLPDEEGSELCAAGEEAFAQAALPSPLAPTA
jgi:pentatricopeptide repeat domain-containing protein 1